MVGLEGQVGLGCSMHQEIFKKELPGTDLVFQPEDMAAYEDDAWDIRISIGTGPLEEAYYCTVEDPKAKDATIQQLLDRYALNPERRDHLDTAEYPELPFLLDALLQYRDNDAQGLIELEYYVNHNPDPHPISLRDSARSYLSGCTYHDQSHDYLILDLVIVAKVPEINEPERLEKQRLYGDMFILFLLGHHDRKGPRHFEKLVSQGPIRACYEVTARQEMWLLRQTLDKLEMLGYIEVSRPFDSLEKTSFSLALTEPGQSEIRLLTQEAEEAFQRYDVFESVSISPCALGVPDGFDARIQMMEYEGVNHERLVYLLVLLEHKEELMGTKDWYEQFTRFEFYERVQAALAFKTNFAREVVEALKELAQ